ncbi:hypothetical protein KL919_005404, partial [Ogataea angusta]
MTTGLFLLVTSRIYGH